MEVTQQSTVIFHGRKGKFGPLGHELTNQLQCGLRNAECGITIEV